MSSNHEISVASLSYQVSHAKTFRKELNFMSVLFLAVVYMCFMITEKHNAKCKKILHLYYFGYHRGRVRICFT